MSEPETLRVFVNGRALSLPRHATILDAVRAYSAGDADAVAAGERAVTDSRGLPVAADTPVAAGTVLRVVASRAPKDGPKE